jgi:hypothetical protein
MQHEQDGGVLAVLEDLVGEALAHVPQPLGLSEKGGQRALRKIGMQIESDDERAGRGRRRVIAWRLFEENSWDSELADLMR